ncbi:MAG: cysteine--tRNA ligase [Minicystis sp.]
MTTLRLKNTLTKSLDPFVPLDPAGKTVTLYSCGPTVYSHAHIGNFRSFLMGDLLRRVLERNGYLVRHVMNITDVGHMTQDHLADATGEDKLAKAARELGTDPFQVAAHFERLFVEDAKQLRLKIYRGDEAENPAQHPRATEHVAEMLAMIEVLLQRGYAYVDGQGQVYFEVAKFPEYGALSGKVIDDLEAGKRVEVREEKKDPRDFALWKVDEKHLMVWDPHGPRGWPEGGFAHLQALVPAGIDARLRPGFPGWHIECSAMAKAHLGPLIDLHTGGEDNIFPHHECEIAQSYGASEEQPPPPAFARTWVHGRHLMVNGRKMSKRDGTFFTLRDLLDPTANGRPDVAEKLAALGFPEGKVPAALLRYALLSNQYTEPMNFTFDLLGQSRASVERIQSRYDRLREIAGEAPEEASEKVRALCARWIGEFDEALNDNLNTPNALSALFGLIGELNQLELSAGDAVVARAALESVDEVLEVLDRRPRSGVIAAERIAARIEAGGLPAREVLLAMEELGAEAIETLVAARQAARKARDFQLGDAIRDHLKARAVVIEDTAQGVRWKRG